MKKLLFILFSIVIFLPVEGQYLLRDNPDFNNCELMDLEDNCLNRIDRYYPYGGVFTPKGQIRIIVIFISYGGDFETKYVEGWDANSTFPNWATNQNQKAFYQSYSEFSPNIYQDRNRKSVSNFYYQMSQGAFQMIADYYPVRIVVDATECNNFGDVHRKAIQQIPSNFNWNLYDNRTNNPQFRTNNSESDPDNYVDYIVFCHRFSKDWDVKPASWMTQVYDGQTGIGGLIDIDGTYKLSSGCTVFSGGLDPIMMFVHEMGHQIYNGPHYNGGNKVSGSYFYAPAAGWGMMQQVNYSAATGWERYLLDWVSSIKASGENSKIESVSDLNTTHEYTLRDHITTGDAIRIRVPCGDDQFQYLWIENHQGISTFDSNANGTVFCGSPIPPIHCGITAYVESFSSHKDTAYQNISDLCNSIRYIHQDGNFDFTFDPVAISPEVAYCENQTYPLHKGASNPIGGQNVCEYIRQDYNNDGEIIFRQSRLGYCNAETNEWTPVICLDDEGPTARYFTGSGLALNVGTKVGISEPACVMNNPQYDESNYLMDNFCLNGISFRVVRRNPNGSIVVHVEMEDVNIDKNVRWAGAGIELNDITGDNRPDVNVLSDVMVTINKSQTPNRHANPNGSDIVSSDLDNFITPTHFYCLDNSYFKQQPNSKVNVIENSTLELESGSVYEVGNNAELNINDGATLIVKTGATLHVKGQGHVEIGNTGYICIENGANIVLDDALSVINLRPGYHSGVNPAVHNEPVSNCSSTPLSYYPHTGSGSINLFKLNRYVQNTNLLNNAFYGGNEIYAGHHVTNKVHYGNVVVQNNATVIFDSTNGVHLDTGFEVKSDAKFEVR